MQLGKTLVGAIIGAALGIGLLYAVYLLFHIDAVWLAIPVALLTGLGVRVLVATSGHASYLRGALTVLLALGAYLGGWFLVAAAAKHQAASASKPNASAAAAESGEAGDAKEGQGEPAAPPAEAAPPAAPARNLDDTMHRPAMPRQFSTWDFIFLAAAALLAYELGRGTGGVPSAMASAPGGPVPSGTHPDA
jgi:ABC-type antimicrobial peptide transport system permease subunit